LGITNAFNSVDGYPYFGNLAGTTFFVMGKVARTTANLEAHYTVLGLQTFSSGAGTQYHVGLACDLRGNIANACTATFRDIQCKFTVLKR
jgi:hypothetical protein